MIASPASMPTHRAPLPVQAVVALYEAQLNSGYWMTRCAVCPTWIPKHRQRCTRHEEAT